MGISHSLNIGAEALYANRQGVDTAGHNIANAQTEGFSRQRVNVAAREPSDIHGNLIGNGVYVDGIGRDHDKFIEKQLVMSTQELGESTARTETLGLLESIYSPEMDSSVADKISNFFNALHELSSQSDVAPIRANLREAAQDLTAIFHSVQEKLNRNSSDIDQKIEAEATEIDGLLDRISRLNESISTMEVGGGREANDLRDQRDLYVRKLSEKININYYTDQHGMLIVRGPKQSLLVDGNIPARVSIKKTSDGRNQVVISDNRNERVTILDDGIEAGKLKAYLDVRDRVLGDLKRGNNELSMAIAKSVNSIHREGFGLEEYSETIGRDFFSIDSNLENAAATIEISSDIKATTNAISAGLTPNAPGDNGIINRMLSLPKEQLLNGGSTNFIEYYSNMVGVLGLETQAAKNQMNSDSVIQGDLESRRESISGVSLDEEAINLMRWQTAFAASSKLITTADEMLETILSLKR